MKKVTIFIIVFWSFSVCTHAQKVISLQEAVQLGLQNNKQLKVALAKVELAEDKEKEIINLMLPRVNFQAEYRRLSSIEEFKVQFAPPPAPATILYPNLPNTSFFRLGFTEPLFTGLRGFTALRSNQLLVEASQLDVDKDKTEVFMNVVNTYYNMYKIELSSSVLEESLKMVESRLKDVNNLKNNGMATQNDILKVELQKSNIELNKLELETNRAIANYNFNILLGLADTTYLEIDTTALYSTKEEGNLAYFLSESFANRSDLQAQQIRSQVAENSIKIQKGAYYPQFYMSGNYMVANPNQRNFPPEAKYTPSWDFGVGFTWDITGLYTNKNNVNNAKINASLAEIGAEGLEDMIKMEVNQAYLQFNQSKERIALAQKAVTQAEENQRMMTSKFKNQLATISDVLDADLLVIQAQMSLASAKTDSELAYYKLLKATGKLKDK